MIESFSRFNWGSGGNKLTFLWVEMLVTGRGIFGVSTDNLRNFCILSGTESFRSSHQGILIKLVQALGHESGT